MKINLSLNQNKNEFLNNLVTNRSSVKTHQTSLSKNTQNGSNTQNRQYKLVGNTIHIYAVNENGELTLIKVVPIEKASKELLSKVGNVPIELLTSIKENLEEKEENKNHEGIDIQV